jgi:hypothetical protein
MFEHMFEHGEMTVSPLAPRTARLVPARNARTGKLERAQAAAERAHHLQGTRDSERVLEVLPAVADLLPDGGLKPGCAYTVVGSTALVAAVIASPSSTGAWCGVVGMPGFAAEGVAGLGVDLERVVFVPHPGREWINVVAALADALTVVVVRPPGRVSDAEAARLGARLRQRGSVLVACGAWPRTEATLRVTGSDWRGLGEGYGHLTAHRVEVAVTGRGRALRPRRAALWLPDEVGVVRRDGPVRAETLRSRLHNPSTLSEEVAV